MNGEVLIGIWAKAHDSLDGVIKFCTHGLGTHAAFVRGNGLIIENFFPRVRQREWNPGERETTELYRIEGTTPDDWQQLEHWFEWELRHPRPYSVRDLFRYAVNLPPVPGRSCFCSMWVLRGCRLNLAPEKQPLVRLQYQDYGSPRDLRISPRLHLVKK